MGNYKNKFRQTMELFIGKSRLSMELDWFVNKFEYNMGNCKRNSKFRLGLVLFIGNPNTTWDIVKENLDKDWNWLSRNPNITWEIVQTNPKIEWNWDSLSKNKNITWRL